MANSELSMVRKSLESDFGSMFRIEDEVSCEKSICVFERSSGLGVAVDSLDGLDFLVANGAEKYLNSRFNGITQ